MKSARANGQKIIANFHSHPATPARPSEEDIRLAYDPNIVYIIISLAEAEPVIKAFVKDEASGMKACEIRYE
jgi:proteasome lid subunit RPN8/RPN11